MIYDRIPSKEESEVIWEVIIVGAGTVGLHLAIELQLKGITVLVLEAGGATVEHDQQTLNKGEMTGRAHDGALFGRARALGGTSNLWGGQLMRFPQYIFASDNVGRNQSCYGWPISYTELEPWYELSAKRLGLNADEHTDALAIWNRSIQNTIPSSQNLELTFTRWLKQPNIATYYSSELKISRQIKVFLHCQALTIAPAENGEISINKINLIHYPTMQAASLLSRHVVLANGTIEISRLLLFSKAKQPTAAWAQNDNIGRYFQDHLDLNVGSLELADSKKFHDIFDIVRYSGIKHQPKIIPITTQNYSKTIPEVAFAMVMKTSMSSEMENIRHLLRTFRNGAKNSTNALMAIRAVCTMIWISLPIVLRYLKTNRISSPNISSVFLRAHCEQIAKRDSRISLSKTKVDRFGIPLSVLNWEVDLSEQMTALRLHVRHLREFFSELGLGKFSADQRIEQGDLSLFELSRDSYHQCGGAVMSTSNEHGVVDEQLKVFGSQSLYVLGAAVFPVSSYANPTFTAIALASRLAETLREKISIHEASANKLN